jgi:hypothetical protein
VSITTRDGLVSAMAAGRSVQYQKSSIASATGGITTHFRNAGTPAAAGATPTTTGIALSRSSQGAMAIPAASGTSYISSFEGVSTSSGCLMLADRLVEFGGLSGTVTTAQTVSALALPARATGALDVELWLEVYTAIGATPSATVTASYTNQSGTSGRTATLPGGITASWVAGRTAQFALAAGDTGVQSVQSLTSGTSTGTAGNIGLVLRRTLLIGACPGNNIGFSQGYAETDLQICPDDACLELLNLTASTATGTILGNFGIAQG